MRKKLLLSSFSQIHNFTLKPNHLSSEVCDSVGSSKLQWRGLSRAACVPQETSDTRRKSRQKVPKHERRAMVESFVNKYRSENAGKFPTIKGTKKEVGGSYYVVREIIQELEYKSKMKSQSAKDRPIQDDSQSVLLDDKQAINTGLLEEKRGLQTSSSEGRLSNEVETISTPDSHSITSDVKTVETVSSYRSDYVAPARHQLKEEIEQVSAPIIEKSGSSCSKDQIHDSKSVDIVNHPTIEIKSFEKAGFERKVQDGASDVPGVDIPQQKMEQPQGSLNSDESKIDSSNKRESSVAVAPDKSTLWGNLKSFADGILNIWRKL
ncbi:uncharacterized protein LOC123908698 isoform X1 [Trifolium pratense]|nr:uncharacterized protein LOC123908698 isoform X1 [Trifolium pratense]